MVNKVLHKNFMSQNIFNVEIFMNILRFADISLTFLIPERTTKHGQNVHSTVHNPIKRGWFKIKEVLIAHWGNIFSLFTEGKFYKSPSGSGGSLLSLCFIKYEFYSDKLSSIHSVEPFLCKHERNFVLIIQLWLWDVCKSHFHFIRIYPYLSIYS